MDLGPPKEVYTNNFALLILIQYIIIYESNENKTYITKDLKNMSQKILEVTWQDLELKID